MKKILVILTGGTIGSRNDSISINTDSASAYSLISLYREKYESDTEFDIIQPLNILSENMIPEHWNTLFHALSSVERGKYRGIIITHGSDTLSYSAAMLGMLYGSTDIPITITASNYTLWDARSNGLQNFRSCVNFIINVGTSGVFVVYQDKYKKNNVYISTRIREAEPYNDQFSEFGDGIYGIISENKFEIKNNFFHSEKKINKISDEPVIFKKNILLIRAYPGIDYSCFELRSKPAAVLHYLYHSATACVEKGRFSLPEFTARCKENGIPVYTASYKDMSSVMYATAKQITESGAFPMMNISCESAYAKLMIAYNQDKFKPEEIINWELYFENA